MTADERTVASTRNALEALVERGDYYEALGLSPDATGKAVLLAVIDRRGTCRELDARWVQLHDALTRHRQAYDATRQARDAMLQVAGWRDPGGTMERFHAARVWQALWNADHPGVGLDERAEALRREVDDWWAAERAVIAAWRRALQQYGQAVLRVVGVRTFDALIAPARTPNGLRKIAQAFTQVVEAETRKLPEITVDQPSLAQRSLRTTIHRHSACSRCGGTGWMPAGGQFEPRRRSGPASSERRVPCSDCARPVTWRLPPNAQQGWVVQGVAEGGSLVYARIAAIVAPRPRATAGARQQARPQAEPARPHSASRASTAPSRDPAPSPGARPRPRPAEPHHPHLQRARRPRRARPAEANPSSRRLLACALLGLAVLAALLLAADAFAPASAERGLCVAALVGPLLVGITLLIT